MRESKLLESVLSLNNIAAFVSEEHAGQFARREKPEQTHCLLLLFFKEE